MCRTQVDWSVVNGSDYWTTALSPFQWPWYLRTYLRGEERDEKTLPWICITRELQLGPWLPSSLSWALRPLGQGQHERNIFLWTGQFRYPRSWVPAGSSCYRKNWHQSSACHSLPHPVPSFLSLISNIEYFCGDYIYRLAYWLQNVK